MHTLHKYLLYIYLSTCILCTLRTAHAQSEVFFSFLLSASLQFFHFHYHFNYMSRGGGSLTYRLNYHRWPLLNILWYLFLWLPSVIKSSLPHFEHTFHQNGCARTHLISFYNLIHYHRSYQLILLSSNLEYHLILNKCTCSTHWKIYKECGYIKTMQSVSVCKRYDDSFVYRAAISFCSKSIW